MLLIGPNDSISVHGYQLQAFMRVSNLHAIWDSGLIKYQGKHADELTLQVAPKALAHIGTPWTAVQAAQESCQTIATASSYPGRLVDGDYIERYMPVMRVRLAVGGAQLTELLIRLFPKERSPLQ